MNEGIATSAQNHQESNGKIDHQPPTWERAHAELVRLSQRTSASRCRRGSLAPRRASIRCARTPRLRKLRRIRRTTLRLLPALDRRKTPSRRSAHHAAVALARRRERRTPLVPCARAHARRDERNRKRMARFRARSHGPRHRTTRFRPSPRQQTGRSSRPDGGPSRASIRSHSPHFRGISRSTRQTSPRRRRPPR